LNAVSWDRLEAALGVGDDGLALRLALELWRAAPWPALAELVDRLGERAAGAPVRAASEREVQEAWLARARARRPEDLGPLLEAFPRKLLARDDGAAWWRPGFIEQRYAPLRARIAELAAWPLDPRPAAPLLELVARAPWQAVNEDGFHAVYDPLVAEVARTADERLLPRIRRLAHRPTSKIQMARAYLGEALARAAERVEARLADRPPLAPEDAARARALLARLDDGRHAAPAPAAAVAVAATPDALLAAALATPDDDAPRLVWADALLERGDPRGEFVALQFKAARGEATEADLRRMRGLQQRHGKSWLGDNLAAVLVRCGFARGLLDEAELAQNAAADPAVWAAACREPALATVRTLHRGRGNEAHYAAFVTSPALCSLVDIEVGSRAVLRKVVASGRPFTTLRLARPPSAADLRALDALPALRLLSFSGRAQAAALLRQLEGQPLLGRLAAIEYRPRDLFRGAGLAGEWLATVRELRPLPEVRVRFGLSAAARPEGEGIALEVTGIDFYLAELLEAIPCRVVRLRVAAAGRPPEPLSARVRAAIRRHAPEVLELPDGLDPD
jgi:uncharacterized protein (TIGR02996 family)